MILKNTWELEDSKRRKSIHFFGADIAVSAFQGNYPYDPNNRKDKYMSSKYIEKHIKFTEEQYAIVSQKAAELGLRTGAYVKQMAIQGKLIRYDLAELREVTRPFRMIGNELNQIAKKANETGEVTAKAVEDVREQYARLEKVFEKYLKPLKPNVLME